MPKVKIYTTAYCPYCFSAKRLLSKKGVTFEEVDLSNDPAGRRELVAKAAGRTTVPQIWIDALHVGGSDDLYELEATGELDRLLEGNAARGP